MRSFPKPAILALGAAIGLQAAANAAESPKDVRKPAAKPGKTPKPKEDTEDQVNIPLPQGEAQRGVKFPNYDADGRLTMRFEIGVFTKMDAEHGKMERLRIETFKEDGTHDYDLELPDAILNAKTSDLTSKTVVNIKCENYEITGNNMTFNLKTRQGRLGGGVKMIVYDLEKMGGEKAKVEFQKPKEEEPKK
jgi:hypothetical protein